MALRCTDHLIQEHRLILRAVYVLKAMAAKAAGGQIPPAEDVEKVLSFFRRFADEHHDGKEEAVLFPALRACDTGVADGPLQQMLFEHDQERSLVDGLEDALRTQNYTDFSYFGGRMAEILANHIYKEDNILFDLVDKVITRDVDARITREMLEYDQGLRPETRDELVHTVSHLEWKYLGKAA